MLHGLVAQLGAHHIRIVGVEGSNPFKSTKRKATSSEVAFLLVRDRRRRDSNNLIRLAGGKPGGERFTSRYIYFRQGRKCKRIPSSPP